MNNKNLLDRIDVKSPCTESWEEMSGNDEVRFCSHCSKNVVDLSAYTRARAEKLVRDSNGGLCVRYRKDERGRVVTAPPKFTQIKRQAKIAAGVLAATLSVASAAYTQGNPRAIKSTPNAEKRDKDPVDSAGFVVSGVVTDLHGAVIPEAKVLLIADARIQGSTTTNEEGEFRFVDMVSGNYSIEVSSYNFFKKLVVDNISLTGNHKFEKPFVLQIAEGIEVVGELVITGEPLVCEDPPVVTEKIELQKTIDLPKPTQFVLGVASYVNLSLVDKKSKKKLPK